jgi:integrase
VFTNSATEDRYTTNGVRHVFNRAVERAGTRTGDVTLHTLRHTALSRMIDRGYDDDTVMAISGHSSTRMLARYTHPSEERKTEALGSFALPPANQHGPSQWHNRPRRPLTIWRT